MIRLILAASFGLIAYLGVVVVPQARGRMDLKELEEIRVVANICAVMALVIFFVAIFVTDPGTNVATIIDRVMSSRRVATTFLVAAAFFFAIPTNVHAIFLKGRNSDTRGA